jgi:hypothetical protein
MRLAGPDPPQVAPMLLGAHPYSTMSTRSSSEITARIATLLEPLEEILEAYVFGSWARGEDQPHSDIDIAVYVDQAGLSDRGFGYRAELTSELMRALGTNRVDLVILNAAPPMLYHRVLRDGVRILSRDLRKTTVREGRALGRYCDYVPQLQKIDAVLSARVERGEFGR